MLSCVLALSTLVAPTAAAQPPGGPANKLYIKNATKVTARFDIIRHEGDNTIVTTVSLGANQDTHLDLKAIKGDRALIAGSGNPNRPWKVYGQAYFNAADSPFPTVGYVLQQDEDGHIELVALLQGAAGPKGLPKEFKGKAVEEKPRSERPLTAHRALQSPEVEGHIR
ncbi:hypothetical protein VT84_06570 [Gemmata sp. SH-PL17]|uniref:hypothetical protein n=1 Tax=Gemmata sp. SH-PL17 TaxID=1630693 RepID=UPI00078C2450|nr:hypothetical protein [Gemmata sp. SH-PL17]AMV24041.1 hypothetical protein VT84_06570 [Gemmata sp. SH-PL17]